MFMIFLTKYIYFHDTAICKNDKYLPFNMEVFTNMSSYCYKLIMVLNSYCQPIKDVAPFVLKNQDKGILCIK